MIIQSKRVWIAGQFMPAQVKIEDKKIIDIYPYGTNAVDVDYDNDRILPGFISIHMVTIHGIQMMVHLKAFVTG